MKKVKTFLQQLSFSLLPQSSHYETFLQNKFSTSFAFFIKSQLFFSFVMILLFLLYFNPLTLNAYKNSFTSSLKLIPSNFELTIHKGELNTNLFRPFLFWIQFPKNNSLFLVIDETANPEKIKEYESTILLTKSTITTMFNKELRSFSYSQINNTTVLKKEDILKMSLMLFKTIQLMLIVFFPLLLLIIPITLFFVSIIYILLSSIIVYFFYRSFNKHYKFIKILQIGFYSSSLPVLIVIILFTLFFLRFLTFYLPLIILLLFQITGVFEAHYNKSTHSITHHQKIHHKKNK